MINELFIFWIRNKQFSYCSMPECILHRHMFKLLTFISAKCTSGCRDKQSPDSVFLLAVYALENSRMFTTPCHGRRAL